MESSDVYDAIIVGSGATGGWAAMALTAGGQRVLVLEAGPLDRTSSGVTPVRATAKPKKLPAWATRQPVQYRCYACGPATARYFVDDIDNPYERPADAPFDWIRGRQVGGRTLMWNGLCYRMSDRELKAASLDGVGEDWPLSYRDLEPHYDRVEQFLRVRVEPPITPAEETFANVVAERWPERRVIRARVVDVEGDGTSEWPAWTSPGSTLAAAASSGRLTMRADSVVARILVDDTTGRARGVEYIDRVTQARTTVEAPFVVLCASAIESTRLLLNSRTAAQPDGLANSSGTLGRYLMDHVYGRIQGIVPTHSGYSEHEVTSHGLYIPRFGDDDGRAFKRGYGIQLLAFPWLVPSVVAQMSEAAKKVVLAQQSPAYFVANFFGEVLPRSTNVVSVDPNKRDAWGIPVARIECRYGENERLLAADALATIREMVQAAGFTITNEDTEPAPPGRSIHEVGTARMGTRPTNSVLDATCRAWDVPNLFVMDGACFVSSGYQNPTLTMMAIASRACDALLAQWRTST